MGSRLELQTLLENLLGSRNVYFQPPETKKLRYPCITYKRNGLTTNFADDNPYINNVQYLLTIIDSNPDSVIPTQVALLPKCRFDRNYPADGLNHDVYQIFY